MSWQQLLFALVTCVVTALVLLVWATRRWPELRKWLPLLNVRAMLLVLTAHLLFFALMGLALFLPAHALGMQTSLQLVPVAAASWVIGFLVVGAPGGLGVREAVFLELLRGTQPEAQILLLAASLRVITFTGDALYFALGSFWRRRIARRVSGAPAD